MQKAYRPIIAIDVDGPLHAYVKWLGADILDGGPVEGSMEAIRGYVDAGYEVHIISSRLHQPGGMEATSQAINKWMLQTLGGDETLRIWDSVKFTLTKPPALATIDDRAIPFRGRMPTVAEVKAFTPWRYGDPIVEPEKPDMNRSLLMLVSGMVAALASTALRSEKAAEARVAVTEIRDALAANGEEFTASLFDTILRSE